MSLGEVAYNAYGDSRSWRTIGDDPMPAWGDQHDYIQEAWEAAAKAVVESTLDGEDQPSG